MNTTEHNKETLKRPFIPTGHCFRLKCCPPPEVHRKYHSPRLAYLFLMFYSGNFPLHVELDAVTLCDAVVLFNYSLNIYYTFSLPIRERGAQRMFY